MEGDWVEALSPIPLVLRNCLGRGASFVLAIIGSVIFRWRFDLVEEIFWSVFLGVLLSVMLWATGKARFR
jgi:hypothetical protein